MAIAVIAAALAGGMSLTLLVAWRVRRLHARGVLARIGLPRPHRKGFASRYEVRLHVSSRDNGVDNRVSSDGPRVD